VAWISAERKVDRKRRVLVVGASRDLCAAVRDRLAAPDLVIEIELDGAALVRSVQRDPPDAVIFAGGFGGPAWSQAFRDLRELAVAIPTVLMSRADERGGVGTIRKIVGLPLEPELYPIAMDRRRPPIPAAPDAPVAAPAELVHIAVIDPDPRADAIVREAASRLPALRALIARHSHGLAALHEFAVAPPEIVFVELKLPDVDGLTVVKLLRANKAWEHIIPIVITRTTEWNMLAIAMDAGAQGYLFKPLEAKLVAEVLKDAGARVERERRKRQQR
jgi:DNA-binding response OmpR family regulator